MNHKCETCKFRKTNPSLTSCGTCIQIWGGEACTDNWQSAKPRRKDLQSQLDAANERIAELEREHDQEIYILANKIGLSPRSIEHIAHWNLEAWEKAAKITSDNELRVANAEIESMQRELKAKEAEIAEHRRHLSKVMQREAGAKAIIKEQNRELDEVAAKLETAKSESAIFKSLANGKDEFISELQSELESLRKELITRILDDSEFSREIAKVVATELQRRTS